MNTNSKSEDKKTNPTDLSPSGNIIPEGQIAQIIPNDGTEGHYATLPMAQLVDNTGDNIEIDREPNGSNGSHRGPGPQGNRRGQHGYGGHRYGGHRYGQGHGYGYGYGYGQGHGHGPPHYNPHNHSPHNPYNPHHQPNYGQPQPSSPYFPSSIPSHPMGYPHSPYISNPSDLPPNSYGYRPAPDKDNTNEKGKGREDNAVVERQDRSGSNPGINNKSTIPNPFGGPPDGQFHMYPFQQMAGQNSDYSRENGGYRGGNWQRGRSNGRKRGGGRNGRGGGGGRGGNGYHDVQYYNNYNDYNMGNGWNPNSNVFAHYPPQHHPHQHHPHQHPNPYHHPHHHPPRGDSPPHQYESFNSSRSNSEHDGVNSQESQGSTSFPRSNVNGSMDARAPGRGWGDIGNFFGGGRGRRGGRDGGRGRGQGRRGNTVVPKGPVLDLHNKKEDDKANISSGPFTYPALAFHLDLDGETSYPVVVKDPDYNGNNILKSVSNFLSPQSNANDTNNSINNDTNREESKSNMTNLEIGLRNNLQPGEKIAKAKVTLHQDDEYLYVVSNGIPNYQPKNVGEGKMLTVAWVDVGTSKIGRVDYNPNSVSEQKHTFMIPLTPTPAPPIDKSDIDLKGGGTGTDNKKKELISIKNENSCCNDKENKEGITTALPTDNESNSSTTTSTTQMNANKEALYAQVGYYTGIWDEAQLMYTPLGAIGVAINGVPLYNEWAGPNKEPANDFEAFDLCCGHPDPTSTYHYHQYPKCVNGSSALGLSFSKTSFQKIRLTTSSSSSDGNIIQEVDIVDDKEGNDIEDLSRDLQKNNLSWIFGKMFLALGRRERAHTTIYHSNDS